MMYQNAQSGFSLVETLVAVTILLIVIIGPMTISSQSAKSTSFASEQVIAFFLAQEGAELIHKHRDDFFNRSYSTTTASVYTSSPWADFKASTVYSRCVLSSGRGCGIQIDRTSIGTINAIRCSGEACPLYFDDTVNSISRSRYTHTSTANTENTPYRREITLEPISADEIKVTSRVSWNSGNTRDEQSTTVETYLFNTYGE